MTTSTINHLSLSWSLLPLLRWPRVRWVHLRDGHHCPTNIPDRQTHVIFVSSQCLHMECIQSKYEQRSTIFCFENTKRQNRLQGDEDWSTLHSAAGQTDSAHKRTGCWVLEMIIIIIIMGSQQRSYYHHTLGTQLLLF